MAFENPNWDGLTQDQKDYISQAAQTYSEPGPLAGPDEIASEMFYAVADALNPNRKSEANANLTLWCVHVLGPDDVIAAPTHAAAAQHAKELNTTLHDNHANPPGDVLCFAYAAPWPHTPETHSHDLENWYQPRSAAGG